MNLYPSAFLYILAAFIISNKGGAMAMGKIEPSANDSVNCLRINERIILDGSLNESCWSRCRVINNLMQFQPVQGGIPSERTEAKVLYDDNYIYIGITAYISKKEDILATEMERDADFFSDDRIAVIFDTYHDRLNGVFFSTNPLGVRHDLEISQDGQVYDNSWNTYWNVSTSVNDTVWITEFMIPFSSLRFREKEKLNMGFKVIRSISGKNEFDVYPQGDPTISQYLMRLSMAASIRFDGVKAKKPFLFSPYMIGSWSRWQYLPQGSTVYEKRDQWMKRHYFSDNTLIDKAISNVGFNVKYGISKNFTLDLTTNTDFSQVEVDNRVINLTRFEVNLPEKRDFFLEAQDYLNFDIGTDRVFNSRTIGILGDTLVPIIGGLRFTGKQNGYQIGFLNLQTLGLENTRRRSENFSNLRIRKSIINEGSTIGGILTNKTATDTIGLSNQVIGLDFYYRITEKWLMDFKSSYSTRNLETKPFLKNSYNNVRILKNASKGFFHDISLGMLGENYNPEMGYIAQNNIAYTRMENSYISVYDSGNLYFLSFVNYFDYRHRISSNRKETFYFQPVSVDFELKNGMGAYLNFFEYRNDTLAEPWQISDKITIPANRYNMWIPSIEWGANTNSSYAITSFISYGGFYGGKRFRSESYLDNNFNKYFKSGIGYEFNSIKFPYSFSTEVNSNVFTSHLFTFRFTVTFSTRISFKTYLQYDNQSNSMAYNARFRYNPREGIDLYVVFNQNFNTHRRLLDPKPYLINDEGLTVKYIHTFNFR